MAALSPGLFRTTPFRLTMVFLALFASSAAALLIYIFVNTVGEVTVLADHEIDHEMQELQGVYSRVGVGGLIQTLHTRPPNPRPFLYLLLDRSGRKLVGTMPSNPFEQNIERNAQWTGFHFLTPHSNGGVGTRIARGERQRLSGGELLIVAADLTDAAAFVLKIEHALWGAGGLVVLLGLFGGLMVSRNVSRSAARMNAVISAVQGGDLRARVELSGVRDEFEQLSVGLNDMLNRLERSIEGLRHAGDAIAHDLRSPLTRLRARLEVALLDLDTGAGDPKVALTGALEDADGVLRTFSAVLAIARLQSGSGAPEPAVFDPAALAADVAELYAPLCEERGLDFRRAFSPGLRVRGNREFIAQALANSLDNAVKYTPAGGLVTLGVGRAASDEIELSVADTGPGIPPGDRLRVTERFVRLESSRNQPGAGLGLSLVAAVAEAHGGRVELQDGAPAGPGQGPGLRVVLVLPRAA